MALSSVRSAVLAGVFALALIAGSGYGASAQGSLDPDDAEGAWVVWAVGYCNVLAAKAPWEVPFDPTCQELVVMGLVAGSRFILPNPVE